MKIVVTGYMVRLPFAGNALAYAQYILGLERLGHDVVYVEESGWPDSCFDLQADMFGSNPAAGLRATERLFRQIGVSARLWYVERVGGTCIGCTRDQFESALRQCDLLLNIGGVCDLPEFYLSSRRVLIDMDPMFTQIGAFAGKVLGAFDVCFTYGTNVASADCRIPRRGVQWIPTVPPVVPDLWEQEGLGTNGDPRMRFTTIANWSGYGRTEFQGEVYGQKDQQFERMIGLPGLVDVQLEIASPKIPEVVAARFCRAGWRLVLGNALSAELDSYRTYIQQSHGEFSVAKHGYVASKCGWVSDRTACYLASGRPAVVQNTMPATWVPTGLGLLLFDDVDSAVDALNSVIGNYASHARAAREVALDVFDYRVVLPRLLDAAMTRDRAISPIQNCIGEKPSPNLAK